MRSKNHFLFRHEQGYRPETKTFMYRPRYAKTRNSPYKITNEMPATVQTQDKSTTYTPLVTQPYNPIVRPVMTSFGMQTQIQTQDMGMQGEFQTQDIGTQGEFQSEEMGTQANLPPTEADITYFLDSLGQEFQGRINDIKTQIQSVELQRAQAFHELGFTREFINTFFVDYLGIPEEMKAELDTILNNLRKSEMTRNEQGEITVDPNSEYNQMVVDHMRNWLYDARNILKTRDFIPLNPVANVGTSTNIGTRTIGVGTTPERFIIPIFPFRQLSRPLEGFPETNIQHNVPVPNPPPVSGVQRPGSPLENVRRGRAPRPALSINTNVPRRKGPRAPKRSTFPEPDTSEITAANIINTPRRR